MQRSEQPGGAMISTPWPARAPPDSSLSHGNTNVVSNIMNTINNVDQHVNNSNVHGIRQINTLNLSTNSHEQHDMLKNQQTITKIGEKKNRGTCICSIW